MRWSVIGFDLVIRFNTLAFVCRLAKHCFFSQNLAHDLCCIPESTGRDDIGELAPGMAADFVAWKLTDDVAFAGALHDPLTALFMCTPGPVYYSIINGDLIVDKGKLTSIDLQSLVSEHNKRSAKICEAIALD
jgi:hypothetical protein